MKQKLTRFLPFFIFGVALVLLSACVPTADQVESSNVRNHQDNYVKQVPPPALDFPWERYLISELYKLRNSKVSTYSLTWDAYRGKISWECPSIGYPIPGGTQMSNPMQIHSSSLAYPQAEPNGLFPASTSAGTFVICVNPDGSYSPVYVEEYVRTYPQPMQEVNGKLVPVTGGKITSTIDKP